MTEGGLESAQNELRSRSLREDRERKAMKGELERMYKAMRGTQEQQVLHDSSYRNELNLVKETLNSERILSPKP